MTDLGLKGRAALVTGASRNIGRAIALALAEAGASIAIVARSDREAAEAVAREVEAFGVKAKVLIGDVASEADAARLVSEAASALGAPRWLVIQQVCYRAARAGLITGILLAIARVSGETAPLLFTSLNNQFWSTNMNAPMANLPVVIFQFALSPYEDWQRLAWTAALLITLTVLALNIVARTLARPRSSH